MQRLKNISARIYRGYDPEKQIALTVQAGAVVDVSDVKAKQLFKDFPRDWAAADAEQAPAQEKKPDPRPTTSAETFTPAPNTEKADETTVAPRPRYDAPKSKKKGR